MLHLNMQGLRNRGAWEAAGIKLPGYDIPAMREHTWRAPVWVHFGAGNIFRGFLAAAQQTLLNSGAADTGILAAESFDFQIIDHVYYGITLTPFRGYLNFIFYLFPLMLWLPPVHKSFDSVR